MEIWKEVKGYEGIYMVSNYARIKALSVKYKQRPGVWAIRKDKLLKPYKVGPCHHLQVKLYNSGKHKAWYLHRLVALTFIPNPYNKPNINHIDGNPQNNLLDNLEWCTQSENAQHAFNIGLSSRKKSWQHQDSIAVKQFTLDGEYIQIFGSAAEAERVLGKRMHIAATCKGTRNHAGGYKWEYA